MIIEFVVLAVAAVFLLSGLKLVADDQVGIVTKNMFGKPLPQGQIIATKGEVGVQAKLLQPGLHWKMPVIWTIRKAPVVVIPTDAVGVVESVDGVPIPTGRRLGDPVPCNSFQDAEAFLENGGCKGPQVEILRPGVYRINPEVFAVKKFPVVNVPKEKIGVVIANDGIPLPSDYSVAPEPKADCSHFQDGAAFILNGGYRGPQLETLQPGDYYQNPLLFTHAIHDVATVPAGYVAVIISAVGQELEKDKSGAPAITDPATPDTPIRDDVETALITNRHERGILKDPVHTGKYNLNPIAYLPTLVPTSAITIDWAEGERIKTTSARDAEFFAYNQMRFTSKDGFQLAVDIRLILRIPPAHAPWVISRFGTIKNLIEQVAHPLIDSSFRNEAGNKEALQFVHSREEIQAIALEKVRSEFSKYHIEVQGLLIAYIDVDAELLATQTKKQVAFQQMEQYKAEAKAQEDRITVEEKTARANQQSEVIKAKLSVEIAADKADAARRDAEGQRDAIKSKADGNAYAAKAVLTAEAEGKAFAARQVGLAEAEAIQKQADAIGRENLVKIRVIEKIAEGKIVITPQTLITGGSGGGDNAAALLGNLIGLTVAEKVGATVAPAAATKAA